MIEEKSSALNTILNSPTDAQEFQEYLNSVRAGENLEFLIEFKEFEKLEASHNNQERINQIVKNIFSTYVLETSQSEINLPFQIKDALNNFWENYKNKFFQKEDALNTLKPAVEYIEKILEQGHLQTFLQKNNKITAPQKDDPRMVQNGKPKKETEKKKTFILSAFLKSLLLHSSKETEKKKYEKGGVMSAPNSPPTSRRGTLKKNQG